MNPAKPPTVKLLLNGQKRPNQVIGPNESLTVTATTNPPFAELESAGYALEFAVSPGLSRTIDEEDQARIFCTLDPDGPHGTLFEIEVLLRGPAGIARDAKQVYVLNAFAPQIEVDETGSQSGAIAVRQGQQLVARLGDIDVGAGQVDARWGVDGPGAVSATTGDSLEATIDTKGPGLLTIHAELSAGGVPLYRGRDPIRAAAVVDVEPRDPGRGVVAVALQRSSSKRTGDQAFWSVIRHETGRISSSNYIDFVDRVLCERNYRDIPKGQRAGLTARISELNGYGANSYDLLKFVTELFLLTHCGTFTPDRFKLDDTELDSEAARLGEPVTLDDLRGRIKSYLGDRLPYLNRVIEAAFPHERRTGKFFCGGLIGARVQAPCLLELIWSYWHEEGMLVQGINAVSRRFQNVRGPGQRDPLAHFELDPLRPLNNILWGYIQDEWNRLSVQRRGYEYNHHYGLALFGKAVPPMRPADSRSKFLEAFHSLLSLAFGFYKEDSDTTVIADGYPLLNALKEVHMILAQGAHNQFGDLPWTARVEMLIQQWMFARPEMRDFLQSRPMVPYKEPWMPQVDTIKTLQGWSDVSVTHFSDLGSYGEQILLSIRYGDWMGVNDEDSAKNWARYWRPEVQGYIHAYRAVTGVDLTYPERVDAVLPAIHLHKRLALQHARGGPAMLQASPGRARQFLPRL
jgi:hypothetical protein